MTMLEQASPMDMTRAARGRDDSLQDFRAAAFRYVTGSDDLLLKIESLARGVPIDMQGKAIGQTLEVLLWNGAPIGRIRSIVELYDRKLGGSPGALLSSLVLHMDDEAAARLVNGLTQTEVGGSEMLQWQARTLLQMLDVDSCAGLNVMTLTRAARFLQSQNQPLAGFYLRLVDASRFDALANLQRPEPSDEPWRDFYFLLHQLPGRERAKQWAGPAHAALPTLQRCVSLLQARPAPPLMTVAGGILDHMSSSLAHVEPLEAIRRVLAPLKAPQIVDLLVRLDRRIQACIEASGPNCEHAHLRSLAGAGFGGS